MTDRLSARERVAALARNFDEQDTDLEGFDPLAFPGYAEQLARARAETGSTEACIWGWAEIGGQRVALVVFDFAFLGGSMGGAVGEKVARAFDAARRARAPVVTVPASGGARMQEGMWSLVQMAKTVEARGWHTAAGLPHITLLTSPTTGGVYASFASLADVIYAEPNATMGFAGPRVVEELTGTRPDADVHTAEFALEHGLVDAIVPRADQPETLARTLRTLSTSQRERETAPEVTTPEPSEQLDAWERLQLVRDPSRPKGAQILDALLADTIELRGDRTGGDDSAVVVRVGHLRESTHNVVAVAQDASGDGRIRPEGFRKAIRAIELAGRIGLPVLTVIDTRGADPLPSSEASGVASGIARTFDAMMQCPSPTLAVLTGEGGSGGALAMATADRVVAWSNAVFSVIAPEGAAAILYRDPARAPELARTLRITVPDLMELGVVDVAIPEPPGGVQAQPQTAMKNLSRIVSEELERLAGTRPRRRSMHRHRRWRSIGDRDGGR